MTWAGTGGARSEAVDPFATLAPLAAAATVRIYPPLRGYDGEEPGPLPWGSGFFVAPGWVLTCAHVALGGGRHTEGAEGGREVGLSFGDTDRPAVSRGRVEWAQPETGPADAPWPAPDLALIRLLEPHPHECVWLSERTAAAFSTGQVAFFGCAEVGGRIEPVTGRCTIRGTVGTDGRLKLGPDDEIPEGASGGPVIDLERGEVIGVVKARRNEGRDGGLCMSVVQLRRLPSPPGAPGSERDDTYHRVLHAHDRYHADRHRATTTPSPTWTDAQKELGTFPGGVLSPGQRAELLGLLAALPPPASTPQLDALIADLRGRPLFGSLLAPRGWRDALGVLYEPAAGGASLDTILRLAVRAATADHPFPPPAGAEEELLAWARRTAADEGLPHWTRTRLHDEEIARQRARADAPPARSTARPRPGPLPLTPPFVLLEITPRAWEPSRYDWVVSAPQSTGEFATVDADDAAGGYDQPSARLRAALAEAFRRCDEAGRPVMLQAALPYALLDLPLDAWHVPAEPGTRLGEQRPVVIRCAEPGLMAQDDQARRTTRQARWEKLHAGPMTPLVLDCVAGHRRPLPGEDALAAHDLHTVPALCRGGPDGEDPAALYHVLVSGYNVVLWRRGGTAPEPGCGDFHRGVIHTVRDAQRGGALPEALRRLRAEVGSGVPETYWSAGLSLLYADPAGALPGADLLEAP